jgi:hypothetical protein
VFSEGWDIAVAFVLNFGQQRAIVAAVVTFPLLIFVVRFEVLTAVVMKSSSGI